MDEVGLVEWTVSAIHAQTAERGKILGGSAPDAGFHPNGRTARAPQCWQRRQELCGWRWTSSPKRLVIIQSMYAVADPETDQEGAK